VDILWTENGLPIEGTADPVGCIDALKGVIVKSSTFLLLRNNRVGFPARDGGRVFKRPRPPIRRIFGSDLTFY